MAKDVKIVPPSKGHKPKGAHGRAAVKALGRTKTTGNFARIEKAHGKGAAIAAYQNALHAHKAHGGTEVLGRDSMKGRDLLDNRAFTLKDKIAFKNSNARKNRPDCM